MLLEDMDNEIELRGLALYERLMELRPPGLFETKWAERAGLNQGWFTNLRDKNTSPRTDTLRKLLYVVHCDLGDLYGTLPKPNARPIKLEGASAERLNEDLPVYGTALGAARTVEGEAVEQTTLNRAEVVHYAKRPVVLNGVPEAYLIYVSGSSMSPRFEDGELAAVNPKQRPRVGDDVIIYLRPKEAEFDDGETARAALIKRLVRRTATQTELQQFSPAKTFKVANEEIVEMHRVVPPAELLA